MLSLQKLKLRGYSQEQATQQRDSTEEVETYNKAMGCDAPTLETEWEAHDKDHEAEQEADRLSEEEEGESSDLAQLFPFTRNVIKTP